MIKSAVLDKMDQVVHGFGTRHDSMRDLFSPYWEQRPIQHERHGTHIALAEYEKQDCGEADGMLTSQPGLLLCIATADCVPILLARKDGKQVAALHVGWRGASDGIIARFAELLIARGDSAADWHAATGPSAGACCYEVSNDVIAQFRDRYDMPRELIELRPRHLNLAGITSWQLQRAGYATISAAPECTICHAQSEGGQSGAFSFHSYRRDRATRTPMEDVQWSVIAIKNAASG
jgi:YfiH family protein